MHIACTMAKVSKATRSSRWQRELPPPKQTMELEMVQTPTVVTKPKNLANTPSPSPSTSFHFLDTFVDGTYLESEITASPSPSPNPSFAF